MKKIIRNLIVLAVLMIGAASVQKSEASPLLNVPLIDGCNVDVVVDVWYPVILWHLVYHGTCQ